MHSPCTNTTSLRAGFRTSPGCASRSKASERPCRLERAAASTIRVRLLMIGATILRNTRPIRLMLASHHPMREVFAVAARRLAGSSP